MEKDFQKQFELLSFGVTEITPEDEFKKMLLHSIDNNKSLRVKCGIDPTSVDVHIGHTVPYRKMRQFQDWQVGISQHILRIPPRYHFRAYNPRSSRGKRVQCSELNARWHVR